MTLRPVGARVAQAQIYAGLRILICTELRAFKIDVRSTHRHILSQMHKYVRPVGARTQIYAGL